jgi:hypothetical protein
MNLFSLRKNMTSSSWTDYVESRGVTPVRRSADPIVAAPTHEQLRKEDPMTVATTLAKPRPITGHPETVPGFDKYWELAQELGIKAGKVVQRAVADFIWAQDIEMYDYEEVFTYLSAIADRDRKRFIWRPLRDRDRTTLYRLSDLGKHGYYQHDRWECRPYDKPVPFEVLQNVKLIEAKFPDTLNFFVSDYAVVDPDPFIMCHTWDMTGIVFGVWDEPQFFKSKQPNPQG